MKISENRVESFFEIFIMKMKQREKCFQEIFFVFENIFGKKKFQLGSIYTCIFKL